MNDDPTGVTPLDFPHRPLNRAALDRIRYRIGAYPEFREAMFRQINAAQPLAAWTHRAPDDPGIALLESAAVVADILTFYQEQYANEAWLRTAQQRTSIVDLVRLLGYRLAPGLGGTATFAIEVKGAAPATIPVAHSLKAQLAKVDGLVDFATSSELTAYPSLSKFRFYRPRNYGASLPAGASAFEITAVGGESDTNTLAALALKKGDRLVLAPPDDVWTTYGQTYADQADPQFVTVSKVTRQLGRLVVEIEGALANTWAAPVMAYVVGRNFRHFGHLAPPKYTETTPSSGTITGSYQSDTEYTRHLDHSCSYPTNVSPDLDRDLIPLDQEVTDLARGGQFLITADVTVMGNSTSKPFAVVRTLASSRPGSASLGNLNGPTTLAHFTSNLLGNTPLYAYADIRTVRVYELKSVSLTLQQALPPPSGGFPTDASGTVIGDSLLCFYGTASDAALLVGRRLFLQAQDGRTADLVCASTAANFAAPAATPENAPRFWPVDFSPAPVGFDYDDFDETAPTVDVFGNLVDATQGKAEKDTPLGNGDGQASFQTFKLPKAPLTFLVNPSATPPEQPELQIYVAGREWTRVDSLFGRGPSEQAYIVREDAAGDSYVQFGDGQTGARLPSGVNNVVAHFRTGAGAHGPVKPGAAPTMPVKIPSVEKLHLLGNVSGGSGPEDEAKARTAAPGKVQGLGRLVSIRDYETEVLGLSGVVTANASWGLVDNTPSVLLRVLLEAGREGEFGTAGESGTVADTIAAFQRDRGSNRFPVSVQQAFLRYAWVELVYAADPALLTDDVETAIKAALGLAGDDAHAGTGLFGLHARQLAEPEYAMRIEARVQQVPGVIWCRTNGSGLFDAHVTDPTTLAIPPAPHTRTELLTCSDDELLQLHPLHLVLTSSTP